MQLSKGHALTRHDVQSLRALGSHYFVTAAPVVSIALESLLERVLYNSVVSATTIWGTAEYLLDLGAIRFDYLSYLAR